MPIALLLPVLQLLQPIPGVITQGVRPGHPAIDIACATGTPVRAAHDGIGQVQRSHTYGITMVLRGSGGLITSYSHLQSAAGSGSFNRGDVIGSCGNTGIWSSGPHLHFESNRPELLSSLEPLDEQRQPPPGLPPGSIGAIGGSANALNAPR